jgi:hypothetical protein
MLHRVKGHYRKQISYKQFFKSIKGLPYPIQINQIKKFKQLHLQLQLHPHQTELQKIQLDLQLQEYLFGKMSQCRPYPDLPGSRDRHNRKKVKNTKIVYRDM